MSKIAIKSALKFVCGGVAVVLGIAACFTPLAPIMIVAAVCGAIAWCTEYISDAPEKHYANDSLIHDTGSNKATHIDLNTMGLNDDHQEAIRAFTHEVSSNDDMHPISINGHAYTTETEI